MTRLLLTLCLLPFLMVDFKPASEQVTDHGANFTWSTKVDLTQDKTYKVTHSIKNHTESFLSIEWKDGGFACVGDAQIPPLGIDEGTISGSIYEEPILVSSNLKFGVGLGYAKPSQVYIDLKSIRTQGNQFRVTEYDRRDKNGTKRSRISIASRLNENQYSVDLNIDVAGGFNLILPQEIGEEIKASIGKEEFGDWTINERNLTEVEFKKDGVKQFVASWLKPSPTAPAKPYVVLTNKNQGSNSFSVTLSGRGWTLKKLRFVGFTPEGALGIAADVYVSG